jgi:segregation and condensation protein B
MGEKEIGEIISLEEDKGEEIVAPVITNSTAEEIENEFELNEKDSEELVEAALFVAGRFLNLEELMQLTELSENMIRKTLKNLEKKYTKGALQIVIKQNAYKMDLKEKYHFLSNKLATGNQEFTKAEQETLAIIAYKQPVKQSIVIKIRGNKAYDHIKKFKDLNLLFAKPQGHTLILELSDDFYEYFNLHNKELKPEKK